MSFIKFENVSFNYQHQKLLLNELELSIDSNSFTAVTGPNGSGKTTLGKLAMGILKPLSGKVLLEGRDISTMSLGKVGSKIGYLFQNPEVQIFANTVIDDLGFVMRIKNIEENEINKKIDTVLDFLNISDLRNSNTFNLSYGEKQRLAIAGILINEPQFLILDEPTTGLDIGRKKMLSALIEKLLAAGKGLMIISHDHKFINNFSGKVLKISGGKIYE